MIVGDIVNERLKIPVAAEHDDVLDFAGQRRVDGCGFVVRHSDPFPQGDGDFQSIFIVCLLLLAGQTFFVLIRILSHGFDLIVVGGDMRRLHVLRRAGILMR